MSASDTKLLYWAIVLVSFFFAFVSQRKNVKKNVYELNFVLFAISFAIPCFFFAVADISNDYEQYCYIFESSELTNFNSLWIEPGYALLNAIIKIFTNNSAVAISIIKILELSLVYYVIYDYRQKINVGLAVWAFLSLSYLDSFCMLRINLAAAIILVALDFYENKGKIVLSLVLYILACTVHYSSVMLIAPIGAYFLCSRKGGFKIHYLVILLVGLVFVHTIAKPLLEDVLNAYAFLNKYSEKYGTITAEGSGLMQYVYHFPFVFLFLWFRKRIKAGKVIDSDVVFKIVLAFVPFSLFYGTMGYSIEVIGRSFVLFNYLWVIGMPCFCQQVENKDTQRLVYLMIFVWMLYRFYVYVTDALEPAGIQIYHMSI